MKVCVSRIVIAAGLAGLLSLPAFAGTTKWQIDPKHSSAQFAVTHLMISTVRGEFHQVNGTVVVDDADISKSYVNVAIDATTVDTREPDRDKHLMSPDFFDVAKYPSMTFKSTKVESNGPDKLKVTGDLTIRGVNSIRRHISNGNFSTSLRPSLPSRTPGDSSALRSRVPPKSTARISVLRGTRLSTPAVSSSETTSTLLLMSSWSCHRQQSKLEGFVRNTRFGGRLALTPRSSWRSFLGNRHPPIRRIGNAKTCHHRPSGPRLDSRALEPPGFLSKAGSSGYLAQPI